MASTSTKRAREEMEVCKYWRPTFNFFDVSYTGSISVDDLQKCLQGLGSKTSKEQIATMLAEIDADSDGQVTYEEFVKFMSLADHSTISRKAVAKYFATFDKDGSGYITTAELRHTMSTLFQPLADLQMDSIMDRYDTDGNGQLTEAEFVSMVQDFGLNVVDDVDDAEAAMPVIKPGLAMKGGAHSDEPVEVKDPALAEILKPLANVSGKVCKSDVECAVKLWTRLHSVKTMDAEEDPTLHWEKGRIKKGLGEIIYKANHIALIVSNVGKSAAFYTDVIGFQQIRRPDFDRHGAWFTMGNLELHLIKGEPIVHSGKDLIVGHISIETYDIDRAQVILDKMGYPYRQNVSVPKGKMAQGSGTNASNNSATIVKQFFLRDPDGYYLEICNCDVLTKYCLGDLEEIAGYDEGVALNSEEAAVFINLGLRIAQYAQKSEKMLQEMAAELKGAELKDIVKRMGITKTADSADEAIMKRLRVRQTIYADVCQNETEESMIEILKLTNNYLPHAMMVMEIRAAEGQIVQPPAFYDKGLDKIVPDTVRLTKRRLDGPTEK